VDEAAARQGTTGGGAMLRRIRKPQGKLAKISDEIEVHGWLVQDFIDEDERYYERARKDTGKGKVAERWYRLED